MACNMQPHSTTDLLTEPHVQRAVAAMDIMVWEFGGSARGIRNADDMRRNLSLSDKAHELGTSCAYLGMGDDGSLGSHDASIENNLAYYFLANDGSDYVGDAHAHRWGPRATWTPFDGSRLGYDYNLGPATGTAVEYPIVGLFLRQFENGWAATNWSGATAHPFGQAIPHGRSWIHQGS